MLNRDDYLWVKNRGEEIFVDEKTFQQWLQRPNFFLGRNPDTTFKRPIDLTKEEILEELKRIESGVHVGK